MAVPAGYALSLFALVLLSLFLLTPSLQQQQQQQHYASFPRPPPPPPPPRATPSTSTAPSGRAGQRLDESVATAEAVRKDLLRLLDASWQRVRRLVEAETLCRCEEALRGATILLVLATLRRSADLFPSSRAALEAMLRSADVNHDGQLSYAEWANWLTSTKEGAPEAGGGGGTVAGGGGGEGLEGFFSPSASSDPMVSSLAQVLGHALCALKVVARLSSDAPTLAAAFVAGGMMSEALDEEVRLSLLSRLAPQTRDLVLLSLSLEASSPVFRSRSTSSSSSTSTSTSRGGDGRATSTASESRAQQQQEEEVVVQSEDIIMTVDLASIPLLTAPPIFDTDTRPNPPPPPPPATTTTTTASDPIISNLPSSSRQSVVVVDSMSEGPSQGEVVVIREQQEEEEEEEGLVMASRSSSDSEAVRLLLQRLLRVADETVAMQRSLRDLDDKHSLAWREVVLPPATPTLLTSSSSSTGNDRSSAVSAGRWPPRLDSRPGAAHRSAAEPPPALLPPPPQGGQRGPDPLQPRGEAAARHGVSAAVGPASLSSGSRGRHGGVGGARVHVAVPLLLLLLPLLVLRPAPTCPARLGQSARR
eukprot:scaffold458_cov169-Ochromonas_danica.AAC.17